MHFLFFLNPKLQASSLLLCLYSPVCVRPGRNPQLLVFSCIGSYSLCDVTMKTTFTVWGVELDSVKCLSSTIVAKVVCSQRNKIKAVVHFQRKRRFRTNKINAFYFSLRNHSGHPSYSNAHYRWHARPPSSSPTRRSGGSSRQYNTFPWQPGCVVDRTDCDIPYKTNSRIRISFHTNKIQT